MCRLAFLLLSVSLFAAQHRAIKIFMPLLATFSFIVLLIILFRRSRL
jgi:hypothetical protein